MMVEVMKKIKKTEKKKVDIDFPRYTQRTYGKRVTHEINRKIEYLEESDKLRIISIEYDSDDGYTFNIEERSRDLGINFDYYIGKDNSQEYNKKKLLKRLEEGKELFDKVQNNIMDEILGIERE